jgi:hypothetical protein
MISPKSAVLWASGLGAVIVFALFIWPTAYRYDHMELGAGRSLPVRINRFTGFAEVLYPSGWKAPTQEPNRADPARDLTPDDLQKLDGRASLDRFGKFEFDLYNGTNLYVKEVTVEVVVQDEHRKEILRRLYRIVPQFAPASPLRSDHLETYLGFVLAPNQHWNWRLIAAKGTKNLTVF